MRDGGRGARLRCRRRGRPGRQAAPRRATPTSVGERPAVTLAASGGAPASLLRVSSHRAPPTRVYSAPRACRCPTAPPPAIQPAEPPRPEARAGEVARLFLKLGVIGFGGPAAHIALMEDEVVRRRRWLSREQFLDLLGATNLIPGPNSTEMAIHVGFVRAGWPGLVLGGACFILPAMLITLALAAAYGRYGRLPEAGMDPLRRQAGHHRRRGPGDVGARAEGPRQPPHGRRRAGGPRPVPSGRERDHAPLRGCHRPASGPERGDGGRGAGPRPGRLAGSPPAGRPRSRPSAPRLA